MPSNTERKTIDLVVSPILLEVLSEFKEDSEVARLLLYKRLPKDVLVENPVNFITVSEKDPNLISYLTQEKIAEIEADPTCDYWTVRKRIACKPGSFVKRLFKDMPDKEIEKFSNHFRAVMTQPKFPMEVVSGEQIRKYYSHHGYFEQRGSLGASCMKYPHTQPYLDIYVQNPELVTMLIMKHPEVEDKILGRALLWNFNGNKIMDRIYSTNDEQYQIRFKKWAAENGYTFKAEQNFNNCLFFQDFGSEKEERQYEIQLTNWKFDKYPYLDTFKWFDKSKGILYNYRPEGTDDIKTLAAPDGNQLNYDYMALCEVGRMYHYAPDIVRVDYINKSVHSSLTLYSECNNAYILQKDAVFREDINDYIFVDDTLNNKESIQNRVDYFRQSKGRRASYHTINLIR